MTPRQEYMKKYNQLTKAKEAKKRYKKTKQGYATRRLYQERLKMEIFFIYSCGEMKCAYCGYDKNIDALSIDHINNNGYIQRKEKNLNGFGFYKWLKSNNYPEGFQVLCRNCNWIKRTKTLKPWG